MDTLLLIPKKTKKKRRKKSDAAQDPHIWFLFVESPPAYTQRVEYIANDKQE